MDGQGATICTRITSIALSSAQQQTSGRMALAGTLIINCSKKMDYVEVTIHKPLYDTYCNIRDTYLRDAIRSGKMLKINIPQGSAIVDPKEWIRTGKLHTQVFKIKSKPMRMYGNFIPMKNITNSPHKGEQLQLI